MLLLGCCALGLSSLCLASAHRAFNDSGALAEAMERENIAREAMERAALYFASEQARTVGEPPGNLGRNSAPVSAIPQAIFAALPGANSGAVIEGAVIDLNYADSFAAEARRVGIPQGRRSLITVAGGDGEAGAVYVASRFEVRVTVTLNRSPRRAHTLIMGLLTLTGQGSGERRIMRLYLKK